MTLRQVDGLPGPPWERELQGTFEKLAVESELLAGNPLGDPTRRPLYVYLPPGVEHASDDAYPAIYVIQGMTGQLDMWLARSAFEPTMVERTDAAFAADGAPRAVVVFVDAWTSYGGSQFVNSAATGRYMDYLCDEVVPFVDSRYPTIADRDHRGITGKSSGGYGAMMVPMLRPDVFGALASHAGDALFEVCYQPEFPHTARILRDRFEGSYDLFWERLRSAERFDFGLFGHPLDTYAMAACYSPDESRPGEVVLPFDVETGRLYPDVWERWLEWDPVRVAPKRMEALASLRHVYLDAGRSDDYFLDLGAIAFSKELKAGGIDHELVLFDGTHGGLQYRYPKAITDMARALDG
ncbi:MAG TPA: alpha/beta hydrolase-fold protein [Actinomycetota bacterium]|nr:alpha/beta hydrolase-fold protein [Actinomycetota bacterium]